MSLTQENKVALSWPANGMMAMSDAEYLAWAELLKERIGIVLDPQRKSFLLSKLSIRMQELGIKHYQDYFTSVTDGASGRVEWETLVDRLTVHETRFFRDARALSFITQTYFEQLDFENTIPSIHIWSVGCSTGEEPYSLMMHIDRYVTEQKKKCYLAVTASDVSRHALATAKNAVYHKDRFKQVDAQYIQNYLDSFDDDHYQINDSLRKRICFNRFNLIDLDTSSVGKMEIILCQNVLIYFNRETRILILNQLVEHLVPGGLLILAAGEISFWKHPDINMIQYDGVLAFQRKVIEDQPAITKTANNKSQSFQSKQYESERHQHNSDKQRYDV